jgi:hypothetical protein
MLHHPPGRYTGANESFGCARESKQRRRSDIWPSRLLTDYVVDTSSLRRCGKSTPGASRSPWSSIREAYVSRHYRATRRTRGETLPRRFQPPGNHLRPPSSGSPQREYSSSGSDGSTNPGASDRPSSRGRVVGRRRRDSQKILAAAMAIHRAPTASSNRLASDPPS